MNLLKFVGTHTFVGGEISFNGASYTLQVAQSKTNNPNSPKYQLVFKEIGHPAHDIRLSGLFPVVGKELVYRGDIVLNGRKQRFVLELKKSSNLAIISR